MLCEYSIAKKAHKFYVNTLRCNFVRGTFTRYYGDLYTEFVYTKRKSVSWSLLLMGKGCEHGSCQLDMIHFILPSKSLKLYDDLEGQHIMSVVFPLSHVTP